MRPIIAILFLSLLTGCATNWHVKNEPFITAKVIRHTGHGVKRVDTVSFAMNDKTLGTNTISHAALEYFYEPTK
jgi:hypothetical protein